MSKLPKLPKDTAERLRLSFGSFDSFDRGGGGEPQDPHDQCSLWTEHRLNSAFGREARGLGNRSIAPRATAKRRGGGAA